MTIEPVNSGIGTNAVRPKSDAEQAGSQRYPKRDGREKQSKDDQRGETSPVPNDQGQITGTLIDVRA